MRRVTLFTLERGMQGACCPWCADVSSVCCSGQSPALQQLPKELQNLVSELIEEAEFKGKQVGLQTLRAFFS